MKKHVFSRITLLFAVAAFAATLTACSLGGEKKKSADTVRVEGVVKDYDTGLALANVVVEAVDGGSDTTDANGAFSVKVEMDDDRGSVTFKLRGYATNSKAIYDGSDISDYTVMLKPVDQSFTIDSGTANTLTISGSSAGVSLPAGGLVNSSRAAVSGTVTVDLTSIDPLSAPETMPGDFTTEDGGSMESFGALGVQISDAAGDEINLASGQSSTVRIAVPSGAANPPSTIPLFHFDAEQGRWVEEGSATLMGTAPNRYYQGTVTHFSTWNADLVYDRATITGVVVDEEGEPVKSATVTATGQSYTGTSSARTNSDGEFSVFVKASSTVLVSASKNGQGSNTVTAYSGAAGVETELDEYLVIGMDSSVTIKLTWGANPSDLDTHLTGPIENSSSRFHIAYYNKGSLTSSPFAQLDVDDVSGYGPEITTLSRLIPGTYRYSVHHFSGTSNISASPARVEANLNGDVRVFNPPATGAAGLDDVWTVFEFVVASDGSINSVTPINTITDDYSATYSVARSASGTKSPMTAAQAARF